MIREIARLACSFLPALVAALAAIGAVYALRCLFRRRPVFAHRYTFQRNLLILIIIAIGVVSVLLVLPMEENVRSGLMQLVGVLVGLAVALSSTTFVGNAMAGFMLRIVRSFGSGALIQVGDHVGRVSEQGVFHTELQTEDGILITIPNMHLVTNPVLLIPEEEPIISVTVSLSYDQNHHTVEAALCSAAKAAGLAHGFVQIVELGDDSVKYRCAGVLTKAISLSAARSRLCIGVLDALHSAGVEVVSPSFITRRSLATDEPVIPSEPGPDEERKVADSPPPHRLFDKARLAGSIAVLREEMSRVVAEEQRLAKELAASSTGTEERTGLERRLAECTARKERLGRQVATAEQDLVEQDDSLM